MSGCICKLKTVDTFLHLWILECWQVGELDASTVVQFVLVCGVVNCETFRGVSIVLSALDLYKWSQNVCEITKNNEQGM